MTLHEQLQRARREILCNNLTIACGDNWDDRNYTEGMEKAFASYGDMIDFINRAPQFYLKLGIYS